MNQGKSKVSYGKELYEIMIINGFNFFSIIFGNDTRYYVSEQCLHIITTKKNERPEFCSKCGIGLDWTAFSTHKWCHNVNVNIDCLIKYADPVERS